MSKFRQEFGYLVKLSPGEVRGFFCKSDRYRPPNFSDTKSP
ncbi:hypothetical protein [Nostoc sp. FACHB-110]|nr:hypothetical protein [Nostoc sp. FACHB-110]